MIRVGLHASENVESEMVGGAYHPAFGELVSGKRYLKKAEKLLEDVRASCVVLGISKGEISKMVGQKRCNIERLTEKFGFKKVTVRETDIKKGEIIILSLSNDYKK